MVQGKAHKYPDNVDTDVIIPARYLNTASHKELAAHCMEDIDKDFVKNVRPGDIIAAGWNFGCRSSSARPRAAPSKTAMRSRSITIPASSRT